MVKNPVVKILPFHIDLAKEDTTDRCPASCAFRERYGMNWVVTRETVTARDTKNREKGVWQTPGKLVKFVLLIDAKKRQEALTMLPLKVQLQAGTFGKMAIYRPRPFEDRKRGGRNGGHRKEGFSTTAKRTSYRVNGNTVVLETVRQAS